MKKLQRSLVLFATAGLLAAPVAACSKTETTTSEKPAEAAANSTGVTITDQWVKAADSGMTGVFGTLKNAGTAEVTVVSATSPSAGRVELHEVVGEPGSTVMQPKNDGFAIPAGGTHVLAPGADHVMLMDLKGPLKAGSEVEVTLTLADGATVPFTAQVRDYAGAGENYQSSGHAGGHG